MSVQVITNNRPRQFVYGHQLTEAEKAEFDYISPEGLEYHDFIRYRGRVYDASEFMRIPSGADEFKGWDGYSGDSFFSGVLIRFLQDHDSGDCVMGRYIS